MPRTFSLYGVSIEISIVFIYRLYIEVVRKRTCIMNNILLYFNVHIQALNIHPLAPLAPLREHNTSCARTITSCEIYFSPSRQGCKDYAMENSEAYKLLTILRMLPSFSRTQLKFTSKPSFIPVKRRYVRVCLK